MNTHITLPKHTCGLSILHNQHKNVYENIEEYTLEYDKDWVSDIDKKLAFDTNELWEVQWYPNTPVGSYTVIGSSLEVVLDYIENSDWR